MCLGKSSLWQNMPELVFTATVLMVASLAKLQKSWDWDLLSPIRQLLAQNTVHLVADNGFVSHFVPQRHPDGLTQRSVAGQMWSARPLHC